MSATSALDDGATLVQAKEWLLDRLEDGAPCPCCNQFAKIYKRQINAKMARSLIRLYRANEVDPDFQHVRVWGDADSREEGKLPLWGLIEEEVVLREDGGRSGFWRITPRGRRYVLGHVTVPKYALVYDSKLRGFEGPEQSIHDALKRRFHYGDLMAGR